MSGILAALAGIKTAIATAVDEYFNRVTLLLNTSSTNGAQNNTFLDSSTNNFTITRNGNTTQGTFTPFSQTGWSNYFNGTSDYLTIGTGVTFGSGAFTIECWFNANAFGTYYTIIGNGGTNSLVLSVDSATSVKIDQINVGSDTYTVSSISLNAWHHLAVVRDSSNNMTVFVDGVRATTGATTVTKNYSVSTKAVGYVAGGDYWHGYISNLRCVVGTAVYSPTSSTLTVPTAPLTAITNTALLTCQSNRFIDNSTNAYSLTPSGTPSVQAFSPFLPTAAYDTAVVGGSGYFDGSGDYLTVPDDTNLELGSGDFTIECWINTTVSNSGYVSAISKWASSNQSYMIRAASTDIGAGWSFFYSTNGSNYFTVFGSAINDGGWHHIAVTRSGNVFRTFTDGVLKNSTTDAVTLYNGTASVAIGSGDAGANPFTGYLSGIRIIKGTAQYTATFTPPTAPPTAVTNTQLLLNYTNAGIYDSASKNVLETIGNAQVSTTQAKFGTTSMYFDGTGDNLLVKRNNFFEFGTGDFTVEAWVYFNSVASVQTLVTNYQNSSNGWGLQWRSDTGIWNFFNGDTNLVTYTNTPSTGTWIHIAVARSGTSLKMFINGTQVGSVTNSTNISGTTTDLTVGSLGSQQYFNGYMDDLRITFGYARYTASFTAPTAAFPLQ